MVQLGGFLGKPLRPLIKTGELLKGNVLKPLGKSVLMSLGITEATSAVDVVIQKKIFGDNINILKWKINWYHKEF